MATHSSIPAWRIPGMGEPGGLPSMGLHRVGHDWRDLAVAVIQHPKGSLDTHNTHTHTHTGKFREKTQGHTGRRWSQSHGATSQETLKMGGHCQQLGERHRTDAPSSLPEGVNLAGALILDLLPPGQWKNTFLLLWVTQVVVICYDSPRKLVHCLWTQINPVQGSPLLMLAKRPLPSI